MNGHELAEIIEDVRRRCEEMERLTGQPVRVFRYGSGVADLVPQLEAVFPDIRFEAA